MLNSLAQYKYRFGRWGWKKYNQDECRCRQCWSPREVPPEEEQLDPFDTHSLCREAQHLISDPPTINDSLNLNVGSDVDCDNDPILITEDGNPVVDVTRQHSDEADRRHNGVEQTHILDSSHISVDQRPHSGPDSPDRCIDGSVEEPRKSHNKDFELTRQSGISPGHDSSYSNFIQPSPIPTELDNDLLQQVDLSLTSTAASTSNTSASTDHISDHNVDSDDLAFSDKFFDWKQFDEDQATQTRSSTT